MQPKVAARRRKGSKKSLAWSNLESEFIEDAEGEEAYDVDAALFAEVKHLLHRVWRSAVHPTLCFHCTQEEWLLIIYVLKSKKLNRLGPLLGGDTEHIRLNPADQGGN